MYVALKQHGIAEISGSLPTLVALEVKLQHVAAGLSASFVDQTTGITTPLVRRADGDYEGTELVNGAKTKNIAYNFVVSGGAGTTETYTLTAADQASGVVSLTNLPVLRPGP